MTMKRSTLQRQLRAAQAAACVLFAQTLRQATGRPMTGDEKHAIQASIDNVHALRARIRDAGARGDPRA
jgi:hypothetical protein